MTPDEATGFPARTEAHPVNLWRLFPAVRTRERERFRFFFCLSCLLCFGQTMGLVGAESLLLSQLGASVLPEVFVLASIVTVLASLGYAFGVNQARNDNYFLTILSILAVAIGVGTVGVLQGGAFSAPSMVGLFCIYYVGFAVCTNHFWTFATDFFDSLGSKRLFPLFTAGASSGGMLGGLVSSTIAGRPNGALELLWGWLAATLAAGVWIRAHRSTLRRSGPLEIEEADESSMDGMRSSLRFLRTSELGRLLVLSSLLMVTALFLSQYLYSSIFAEAFPDPNELARFFGIFLAVANALELLLEFWVTPWLLRRFGIALANLTVPVLTVVSFALLGLAPGLSAGIFARLNRETLENAVGAPVRALLFNALPARLRGRVRAFLEGTVVYSGMAFAGLFLLLWERIYNSETIVDPLLCLGGLLVSLGYLATNARLRRTYLTQLVSAIRQGRIEPGQTVSALESIPTSRLEQLWRELLKGPIQASVLRSMAESLRLRGSTSPLREALGHSDPRVRLLALEQLHQHSPTGSPEELLGALKDPHPSVRLRALELMGRTAAEQASDLLEDPDPDVRSQAALTVAPPAHSTFETMLESERLAERVAALTRLPLALMDLAQTKLDSESSEEVEAAVRALARAGRPPEVASLRTLYHRSPSPSLRRALLEAAEPRDPAGIDLLVGALSDQDRSVRQRAGARLQESGPLGRSALLEAACSGQFRRAVTALDALSHDPQFRQRLVDESVLRARAAWRQTVEAHELAQRRPSPARQQLCHRFLELALLDSASENRTLCFRLLEALEEAKVVRSVEKVLRFAAARIRADALEVLSNLGSRECTSVMVHLLEDGDLEDRLLSAPPSLPRARPLDQLLSDLPGSDSRWLDLAARTYSSELYEEPHARSLETHEEWLTLMEHLLMLRSVPLFSSMTLEQLEAIHHCLVEQQFTEGEIIFHEGDIGDEMYIVLEGEVEILIRADESEPLLLSTVGPGSYFGEMSILDDEPRSAAARISQPARLLGLKGEQLKELIYVMPELAFTIFKVLSERLRRSDRRLEGLARSAEPALPS